mmetsp:Transcript_29515/g.96406  ORF Transcript_29515/g.96406 Transcript_29515/m.96406 type:complete len:267 (-) Transcript_29515:182-982(-)
MRLRVARRARWWSSCARRVGRRVHGWRAAWRPRRWPNRRRQQGAPRTPLRAVLRRVSRLPATAACSASLRACCCAATRWPRRASWAPLGCRAGARRPSTTRTRCSSARRARLSSSCPPPLPRTRRPSHGRVLCRCRTSCSPHASCFASAATGAMRAACLRVWLSALPSLASRWCWEWANRRLAVWLPPRARELVPVRVRAQARARELASCPWQTSAPQTGARQMLSAPPLSHRPARTRLRHPPLADRLAAVAAVAAVAVAASPAAP